MINPFLAIRSRIRVIPRFFSTADSLTVAALCLVNAAAGQNLVVNGSFEVDACPNQVVVGNDISGWLLPNRSTDYPRCWRNDVQPGVGPTPYEMQWVALRGTEIGQPELRESDSRNAPSLWPGRAVQLALVPEVVYPPFAFLRTTCLARWITPSGPSPHPSNSKTSARISNLPRQLKDVSTSFIITRRTEPDTLLRVTKDSAQVHFGLIPEARV
jgi:hypothetical protein